jgi:anti-sigma B factor antagonist
VAAPVWAGNSEPKAPQTRSENANRTSMTWTETLDGELLTIELSGEIDLQESPKLRRLLRGKAGLKTPAIVLDFGRVKYIDSSGVATLLEYYKNASCYSGRLALAGLNDRVRSIFDLVRLGEVIAIFNSVTEAKTGLQRCVRTIPPH